MHKVHVPTNRLVFFLDRVRPPTDAKLTYPERDGYRFSWRIPFHNYTVTWAGWLYACQKIPSETNSLAFVTPTFRKTYQRRVKIEAPFIQGLTCTVATKSNRPSQQDSMPVFVRHDSSEFQSESASGECIDVIPYDC